MTDKYSSSAYDDTRAIQVAIIEDDETIRRGYAYLIGSTKGYHIAGAYASVEEAVKKLADDPPAIILLDVQLPGMRGVDAIPLLKKIVPGVLILVLTVYESEEIIFTALQNGASGYLTKNVSAARVIESIREIMNGGGAMSAGIAKLVIQTFQKNPLTPLTKRETEILIGISQGKSRNKIAQEHCIEPETVKSHIKNIYMKLDVGSKDEAIKVARESRYI